MTVERPEIVNVSLNIVRGLTCYRSGRGKCGVTTSYESGERIQGRNKRDGRRGKSQVRLRDA